MQTVRDAQRRLAAQAPADLRPRVGDDPAPDRRVYVDHGYGDRRVQPVLPAVHARARRRPATMRRRARHGRVPAQLRGSARASCTAGSSRCSSTACSRSSTARSASRARPPSCRSGSGDRRRCSRRSRSGRARRRRPPHHRARRAVPRRRAAVRGAPARGQGRPRRAARGLAPPPMSAPTRELGTSAGCCALGCRASRRRLRGVRRRPLTYAEAERRSRVLARGLLAAGAGRGSRIGLLFPTGVDFVLAWLAAARIGAIAVPDQHLLDRPRAARPVRARRRRPPPRRRRRTGATTTPPRSTTPSVLVGDGGRPTAAPHLRARVARRVRRRWRRARPRCPTRCSTRSRTTSRPTTAWSSCTRRGPPARRRA